MAVTDCATDYTCALVRAALPATAGRILEIGCGGGQLAAALDAGGLVVVAIDSDEGAVSEARSRGVDARLAVWPDFSADGFDAVLFTRSLHHVADLAASLDATAAALRPGGRVIVEDFMAEGAPDRSAAWFASLATLLDDAGLLRAPTPYLLRVLGRAEPEAHHHEHELHASTAIESALRDRFAAVSSEPAAYYFRYLIPAIDEALAPALLRHEQALIEAGAIDPLGRRFVGTRP